MRTYFLVLLCFLTTGQVIGQQKLNLALKQELDSILYKDQLFREYFSSKLDSVRVDSVSRAFNIPKGNFSGGLLKLMNKTDSINLKRVEAIISEYGYPGRSLV